MNNYLRNSVILILLTFIISCGNWGWEPIETDNEDQLNVFGLISLDDSLESFVVVHKTLGTDGPDQVAVGTDIYGSTRYESLYLVKDATVLISDGINNYLFERDITPPANEDFYWYGDILSDPALYSNANQDFSPTPNTTYTLTISTPAGLTLTGAVTTPPIPEIKEAILPDTLSIRSLFQIQWKYMGDYAATIATGDLSQTWNKYICGLDQFGIIEAGDTTWNSSIQSWCFEDNTNQDIVTSIDIRLRLADENYNKYFLAANDDAAAISNFLVGEGGIGSAYGVEGGFGVFGAISADWTKRVAIP